MRRFTLCLVLACAPLVASAGDEVGHWYINPFLGGISADTKRDTKTNDFDYGVGFGNQFAENWSLELNANRASLHDKFDGNRTTLGALTLDLLRIWHRDSTFAPYISVGGGWLRASEVGFDNRDSAAGQVGVGAFVKLWESADTSQSFSLRPDIKARWDHESGSGNVMDALYTLGFTFSWGAGKAVPPAPVAAIAAPPPPPPAPAPAPVLKCPNTPAGVAVDADGCPIKIDVVLEGVTFETNSAVLTAASKPVLDDVAKGLKAHHRLKVEVQGHTDSTGSAVYNMRLSQRRADAVRDYLVSQDVPAGQLTAKGYGKTVPVQSNATAEGRAHNRRVVMHVLENPGEATIHKEGQAQ
ncbi:MAG: OmpA family protein [Steroidobacterales bacterium]|jgi:OOP family OmpA-OmpF porin